MTCMRTAVVAKSFDKCGTVPGFDYLKSMHVSEIMAPSGQASGKFMLFVSPVKSLYKALFRAN